MPSLPLLLAAFILLLTTLFLRLLYILPSTNPQPPTPRKRHTPTRLLIVLGSGGHTAEMFSLLSDLDASLYTHRTYVINRGDEFSFRKAVAFEEGLATKEVEGKEKKGTVPSTYDIAYVPRARRIHQSLLTTPFSSLHCLYSCFSILRSSSPSPSHSLLNPPHYSYPSLLLTNGPATSTVLLLASLTLRFLALPGTSGSMRSIYIESWARVKGLSLSGRILVGLGVCNRVLVQWEGLAKVGKGAAEFRGMLVE